MLDPQICALTYWLADDRSAYEIELHLQARDVVNDFLADPAYARARELPFQFAMVNLMFNEKVKAGESLLDTLQQAYAAASQDTSLLAAFQRSYAEHMRRHR